MTIPYLPPATSLAVNTGTGGGDTLNLGSSTIDGQSVTGGTVHLGGPNNAVTLATEDNDEPTSATIDPGTGTGNVITLIKDSTATLAQTGGSHTLNVDTITVGSLSTLLVNNVATIGTLEVNGTAEIDASSTLTTVTVGGSATLTFTGTAPTTIDSLTVGGTTNLNAASTINTLDITSGTVNLNQSVIGTSATVTTLSIASTGLLDLGAGFLYVDNTSTSFAMIHDYVNAGYKIDPLTGVGDYTGRGGISSSVVIANADFMGVGYYNGALQNSSNPDYVGQILGRYANSGAGTGISESLILIRPTLTGDINGDGVVTSYDVNLFNTFGLYNMPTTLGYQAGDFNGDGVVDSKDVNIFNSAGNLNNGIYN